MINIAAILKKFALHAMIITETFFHSFFVSLIPETKYFTEYIYMCVCKTKTWMYFFNFFFKLMT